MSAAPRFCLAGATATGKSAVAQSLAERYNTVILSADAMLVYRALDIGTAKPTAAERGDVPYFGIDCVTPAEDYSTAMWLKALCLRPTWTA
jgi:tRNA dimethylallyltransferase